ncbi:MAG TPA: ABC transporter permease [Gemmatimonadales bacterium]|nr:ABC transporter permease [Gemmatimonadales bacterium]
MLLIEIWKVALQAIRANKLRSFLTMLGIIIGVGAVITMIALGTGAQKAVQDQIQNLGSNLLTVIPGQSFMRGVASDQRVSLTVDDATAIREAAPRNILAVMPEISRSLQVKMGSQNANISITGTVPDYFPMRNYTVVAGRTFTAGDDEARRRYAVLGAAVPEIFNRNAAAMVGQTILIRGIPFEIIGILGAKGSQGSWMNPDEQIFIPLQTARYRTHGTDRVRSISVKVDHASNMNVAMIQIERALRRTHKIRPSGDNDFQIRNQADLLSTFQQTTQTFSFLLAGIAAVSLLVGGIGIMNIMLVSVTERTREIGVRKALGATRGAILFQFLVEALVLCLVGGLLGVLFGAGGAVALSRIFNWNTLISPFSIALAFMFSFTIGVFFGIWPARRASMLDPIVALRYE